MNLKYKKIILLTLVSTMGIGVVTLSITPKNHKAKENTKVTSEDAGSSSDALDLTVTPTLTVTLAPTLAPTPTPLPVYDLKTEGYPAITKLINSYYDAKLDCNVKKLKTVLSDSSNVGTKKQLKKDIQFIEKYNKIKCYVKNGYEDGTYIVFVYNEIKFINIKTSAPAVDQFYIITDKDGKVKIYSGDFDSEMEEYYRARLGDDDVKELLDKTNTKGEKAKVKDKDLRTFWDKLAQSSSN